MAKRNLSKQQKGRIQTIQERRRARAITKKSVSEEQLENLTQLGPEILGTVITNFGAQVDIEGLEDRFRGNIYRCHLRTNLEPLVTGDRVVWRYAEPVGVVVAREPRDSELLRPDPYGKLRPVAANVDRIAIVFAAKPTPYSNLIDRYLIASEAQNIQPVLIINKGDKKKQISITIGGDYEDSYGYEMWMDMSGYSFKSYDIDRLINKSINWLTR